MQRKIELEISGERAGRTIKTLLLRELGMSSGLLNALKAREGAILLNGRAAGAAARPRAGDKLCVTVEDSVRSSVLPTAGELCIVYEDEDALVVNKPPLLPSHPVSGNVRETLSNYLVYHYLSLGESLVPRIITRLDSGTSGLVLLAKNALAASLLAAGGMEKEYLAITLGAPSPDCGEIRLPLRRCPASPIKWEGCADGQGRAAVTGYQLLAQKNGLSLLRVKPKTGRTHQIRVHLAAIGCPLAGDFLYGSEDAALIKRAALHMERLSFISPISRLPISLSAPAPEDMRSLLPELL